MKKIKLILLVFVGFFAFIFTVNTKAYNDELYYGYYLDTVVDFGDYKVLVIDHNIEQENLHYGFLDSCVINVLNDKDEVYYLQLKSNKISFLGMNKLVCFMKAPGEIEQIVLSDIRLYNENNLPVYGYGDVLNVKLDDYKDLNGVYVSLIIVGLILSLYLLFKGNIKYSRTKIIDFLLYVTDVILILSLGYFIIHMIGMNVKLFKIEIDFIIILVSLLFRSFFKKRKRSKTLGSYHSNNTRYDNVMNNAFNKDINNYNGM